MKYPDFKVGVRCITYNQSNFINDALNGFTMQQTDFSYLCCIVDDASTDGEQGIIANYLSDNFIIDGNDSFARDDEYAIVHYAQHKTNSNCFFVVLYLKHNLSGTKKKGELIDEWMNLCEYESVCEGDDYWTNNEKLQLQVNILDSHPECSLTYHACLNLFVDGFSGNMNRFGEQVKQSYSVEEVLTGYHFHTATIMYRGYMMRDEATSKILSIMGYDVVKFFCASINGTVIGTNKQMSVYRRNNNGISNAIHRGNNLAYYFDKWCEIAECCNAHYKKMVHKTRVTQFLEELYETDKSAFHDKWKIEYANYPYYALRLFLVMARKRIRAILHNIKQSIIN